VYSAYSAHVPEWVFELDQLDPLSPTRGGAQTGILRFKFVVYKWLLLVIGEIISRNY